MPAKLIKFKEFQPGRYEATLFKGVLPNGQKIEMCWKLSISGMAVHYVKFIEPKKRK